MASFININSDTDDTFEEVDFDEINDENYSQVQNKDDIQVQRAMKDKARVVFCDIQYSQSGKGRSSTVNCPFFDEPNNEKIQIIKDQRKCGGIKICPFVHEHIMHYKHTDVDFDSNIFQTIKNTEESRSIQVNTLSFYLAAKKVSCPYIQTDGSRCNGDLIIKKRRMQTLFSSESISQPNTNKNNGYFVGCTSWKYAFPHIDNNGNPIEANLIHLPCNVTFYRLTPVDLINCPFIVLVSVGKYTHPPPPPSHIPEAIKDRFFDSGHIMVLCMTKEQAIKLYETKYFQMDLTYKPVQGDINVFKLNKYDKNHQIILTFARIFTNISNADAYRRMFLMIIEAIKNLTNKSVKIQHIHDDGWCCILGDLDIAQAKGLGLALSTIDSTTQLMQNILTAESFEKIQLILNEISLIDEAGIEGLSQHCSKVNPEIWYIVDETTNNAELAHADINHEGKELNKYGVAKTEQNNGPISHALQSVKRYEERQLEIEERKERLREAKLLNYEKARRLGIEKELGYDE
ncbi:10819_t:CDS:10 [Cetraspora pellucida]|uniref:10819_t:CDS:1 n=1 Tax=Cetraspora pellucida TaxID=1433469 RepID=A0A9N9B8E6_9GLOM|nr:10819_t:CDS:10 [Cetraspora pellucida]